MAGPKQFLAGLPWPDLLKSLLVTAVPAGGSAAFLYAIPLFTPINPKIVQDIWLLAIFTMLITGPVVYFSSIQTNRRPNNTPGFIAAGIFFVCLIMLLALQGDLLPVGAAIAAFLARLFLIGLSMGVSGVFAWCLAWILSGSD